jgi:hypothetical protein
MKSLLTVAFAACVLLTSCSRSEEAFESDTSTCDRTYKNKEEAAFTKEECAEVRAWLKDIKIEFDRITTSNKLPVESITSQKSEQWYRIPEVDVEPNTVSITRTSKINEAFYVTTIITKDDKTFSVGYLNNAIFPSKFVTIALTSDAEPQTGSSKPSQKGLITLWTQEVPSQAQGEFSDLGLRLDELKKL